MTSMAIITDKTTNKEYRFKTHAEANRYMIDNPSKEGYKVHLKQDEQADRLYLKCKSFGNRHI